MTDHNTAPQHSDGPKSPVGATEVGLPVVAVKNTSVAGDSHSLQQPWTLSHRAEPYARDIADRHYNRQKPGTPQFVPPGRCLVLTTPGPALWVTSWPFAEYVKHRWAGAWVNSAFRREGGTVQASDLIRAAVAVTRWRWPDVPELGMVSFVDPTKVRSTNPGYCYLQAGFEFDGCTQGGLLAFRMRPEAMPDPLGPAEPPDSLWAAS